MVSAEDASETKRINIIADNVWQVLLDNGCTLKDAARILSVLAASMTDIVEEQEKQTFLDELIEAIRWACSDSGSMCIKQ
jgi:hypothetical protein